MATDDLVTWSDIQSYIGAASDDETMVSFLITAASRWANQYTSRNLASRTYSDEDENTLYDGDGSKYLMLRQSPVTVISAVYEDSNRDYTSDTLVDTNDYIYYTDIGKLLFVDYKTEKGYQNYKVLYTAGYETVPDDLENAITMLVDFWYKSYDTHRFGVKSVGVDEKRITYELGIPTQVKEAINPYRKIILV
jgi:hypothetical protein